MAVFTLHETPILLHFAFFKLEVNVDGDGDNGSSNDGDVDDVVDDDALCCHKSTLNAASPKLPRYEGDVKIREYNILSLRRVDVSC